MEINNCKLILYGDLLSQPTRSVYVFLKMNLIPFKFNLINFGKGEHMTDNFRKINSFGKIPVIVYTKTNGETFTLAESCSILRFLSDVYEVDEKWYPRNDRYRRALIDQWLDWHHLNTRYAFLNFTYKTVFKRTLEPKGIKLQDNPDTTDIVPRVIKFLDSTLSSRKYIVDDNISIADLIIAAEANQLTLTDLDFSPYQCFKEYLERLNQLPEFKDANKILQLVKDKLTNKAKFQ